MMAGRQAFGKSHLLPRLLAVAVILAGIISSAAGVCHSLTRSQDFQWSGERLLLQHVDPWRDYLLGDPLHGLLATQVPNYLPVLYVLLVPFGWMSAGAANLAWACCNVLFAVVSTALAARFYGLRSPWAMLGITGVMLAATPTRTTISNGQQGLLVLVLWCVALLCAGRVSSRRAMVVGVSYLKYSFAPALVLYLLLRDGMRRGVRTVLWTLVPSAVATVLLWLWITGGHDVRHLLALVTEPLAVTRVGYQPTGDPLHTFMDLMEWLMGGAAVGTPRLTRISLLAAMMLNLAVLLPALVLLRRERAARKPDEVEATGWLVALTAAMSYSLYKHHPYDEVVYLLPLCYGLRHRKLPAAWAVLFLVGYCWFVQPFVVPYVAWSTAWCISRMSVHAALILSVFAVHVQASRRTEALIA